MRSAARRWAVCGCRRSVFGHCTLHFVLLKVTATRLTQQTCCAEWLVKNKMKLRNNSKTEFNVLCCLPHWKHAGRCIVCYTHDRERLRIERSWSFLGSAGPSLWISQSVCLSRRPLSLLTIIVRVAIIELIQLRYVSSLCKMETFSTLSALITHGPSVTFLQLSNKTGDFYSSKRCFYITARMPMLH
jgi:hypothetical protein